jgi:hypothetical protein
MRAFKVSMGKVINERLHVLMSFAVLEDGVAVLKQDESGEPNDVISHDIFLSFETHAMSETGVSPVMLS